MNDDRTDGGHTNGSGKVSAAFLERFILPRLGRRRDEVLVGPRNGVDIGVLDIGHDRVLVSTTDPLFVMPELGWDRAAWFAIHIVASDAATSGLPPRYIALDLNLPESITDDDLARLWDALHRHCDDLGLAVVTGHTGRYEGCAFPTIGAATVLGVGPRDRYVTPEMARPGDRVIITKGVAIETTGLLGVVYRDRVASALGEPTASQAEDVFWRMSVVDDALTAAAVGVREDGVTSMHDATERGLDGALVEVARASGVGLVIEREKIPIPDVVARVCDLFGVDPYSTSSEGTLVITCRPDRSREVIARLVDRGIPAAEIGEVVDAGEGLTLVADGRPGELTPPAADPFWPAFIAARQADPGSSR